MPQSSPDAQPGAIPGSPPSRLPAKAAWDLGRLRRLTITAGWVVAYLLHSAVAQFFFRDPVKRRQFFTRNTGRFSGWFLRTLGFTVETKLSRAGLLDRAYFIVSNHLSYLDILILSSNLPSVFVTSREVEHTFLLGTACRFGGSVFVDRRDRNRISEDSQQLQRVMGEGFNLVVYPEGTTSDGTSVGPLKSSLFSAPIAAGKTILPLCIKYKSINGQPFSERNSDTVCWYGDMSFAPHFVGLSQIHRAEVELVFLQPIEVTPGSDRRQVARQAGDMIRAEYHRGREDARKSA